ncbi:MAG: DUF3575 domain-containing protein, partial [Tannerellaceae bacterium]|nr:DUF3575 domain-containing protein [Tannerellaceae bacterium]
NLKMVRMEKQSLRVFLVYVLVHISLGASGQKAGIKTNFLYWATGTPNIGAELPLNSKSTMDLQLSYNPWNLDGTESNNKKIAHWLVRPEYRYWFCETFMGHFAGVHAFYSQYNMGGRKIPLLLEKEAALYRYKGYMMGGGFSYGYQWIIHRSFSLEFTVGLGYGYMKYDKYDCPRCGEKVTDKKESRHYVGPTRAGITLVYFFNR